MQRDYLHDMGITVIGDVIAILKHARLVYEHEYLGARTPPGRAAHTADSTRQVQGVGTSAAHIGWSDYSCQSVL